MNQASYNIQEISRLVKDGKTRAEISIATNIPLTTLTRIITKYALNPKRNKPPISDGDLKQIEQMKNEGFSMGQIALRLKRKKSTIHKYCLFNNIKMNFKDERSRPWTNDEIENLKELINTKHTYREISSIMSRGIEGIKDKLRKLKLESPFSIKIKMNKELAAKGLKRCHICKEIKEMNCFDEWSKSCKVCNTTMRVERKNKLKCNNSVDIILRDRLSTSKARAIHKQLPFDIDLEFLTQLYNKQNGKCYYTNELLSLSTNNDMTLSIDRLNSSKGYTKDNIVLCSKVINSIKNDLTIDNFRNTIIKIYNGFCNTSVNKS